MLFAQVEIAFGRSRHRCDISIAGTDCRHLTASGRGSVLARKIRSRFNQMDQILSLTRLLASLGHNGYLQGRQALSQVELSLKGVGSDISRRRQAY
jgi:hypothetical protein